jgi:hypothetical protein
MRVTTLLVIGSLLACFAAPAAAPAQDVKLEIKDGDSVKSVLERHVGKRVALVMTSGPDLTGTVVKVGERLVHLGELQGREFFDAAVALDRITAVVIRVRIR